MTDSKSKLVSGKQSTDEILARCQAINLRFDIANAEGFNPYHTAFDSYENGAVGLNGRKKLMSGSYSYLGLSHDERLKTEIAAAIEKYGVSSHGSRALTGSMSIHEQLEHELADFMGTTGGVIFSNGYLTNVATISTLVGEGDTIITEITNHNSIQTGVGASGANVLKFKASDLRTLERALNRATGTVMVVADAVFSMEGTILPLPEISQLCKDHGAFLMVDEAHSFGVLGKTGRGIVEHFDMDPEDVDIRMGTMSKTLTSVGGFVVGPEILCRALAQGSNGYLFTAAQPVALVAAAQTSLQILREEPEIVSSIQAKASYFRNKLLDALLPVWGYDTVPIVPVVYDSQELVLELTKALFEEDIFVIPAMYPAVSKKTPRIRFSITDDHSYENLDRIANTFIKLNDQLSGRDFGVIEL